MKNGRNINSVEFAFFYSVYNADPFQQQLTEYYVVFLLSYCVKYQLTVINYPLLVNHVGL